MKMTVLACFWVALGCATVIGGTLGAGVKCPPTGFDTVANFNLSQYIAAPWYIQQQMENSYQLQQDLYCVRARYVPVDPEDLNKGIIVQNYRNRGGVNENPGGSSGAGGGPCSGFAQIKAFPAYENPTKPTDASKVLVGPAPLAALGTALLGDYWVVAVGPSTNKTIGYDWAIVSAGAPSVSAANGCRTGTEAMQLDPKVVNGVGLWLFSRTPVDPKGVAVMRAKAEELGYDVDVLLNVTQAGCTYVKADPVCDDSAQPPVECTRDAGRPGLPSGMPNLNVTNPFNTTSGMPGGNMTTGMPGWNVTTGLPGWNVTTGMPGNWSSRCFNDTEQPLNDTTVPGMGNMTMPPGPSGGNSTSSAGRVAAEMNWAVQMAAALMVVLVAGCVGVLNGQA